MSRGKHHLIRLQGEIAAMSHSRFLSRNIGDFRPKTRKRTKLRSKLRLRGSTSIVQTVMNQTPKGIELLLPGSPAAIEAEDRLLDKELGEIGDL